MTRSQIYWLVWQTNKKSTKSSKYQIPEGYAAIAPAAQKKYSSYII
jgi:hypothetical protein